MPRGRSCRVHGTGSAADGQKQLRQNWYSDAENAVGVRICGRIAIPRISGEGSGGLEGGLEDIMSVRFGLLTGY
jgi:hypothetical protein